MNIVKSNYLASDFLYTVTILLNVVCEQLVKFIGVIKFIYMFQVGGAINITRKQIKCRA